MKGEAFGGFLFARKSFFVHFFLFAKNAYQSKAQTTTWLTPRKSPMREAGEAF